MNIYLAGTLKSSCVKNILSISKKLLVTIIFLVLFQTNYSQNYYSTQLQNGCEFYKGKLGSKWEAIRTGRPAEHTGVGAAMTENMINNKKQILKQMRKVADWQLDNMPVPGEHPRHYNHWDWTNAALYTGISALYTTSSDKKYFKALEGFAESVAWSCGPRFRHADDICIGQTYLELNEINPDPIKIQKIKSRIDSLMADPMPGRVDWWWCDALYMAPPTLARMAATTGNSEYLDFMNEMWWDASDFLYDTEESLFYRDDRFLIKADGSGLREPNGEKVFWSRGNGWVIAGIARVLQYMPEDYPDRQKYVDMFIEMARKILSLQGADGLWTTSLLYSEGHAHGETSGSGFFCYALAWGINNGILEKEAYLPAVLRTWNGLNDAVHDNGKLGWVQKIGSAPGDINREETEVYGVGAYLLAGSEIIKLL